MYILKHCCPCATAHDCRSTHGTVLCLNINMLCCAVLCCAVSEKTEHLSKLLECVKWRVMGYKGDDADGQPLVHQVLAGREL